MDRFVLRFEKYNQGASLRGILDHCARRKTPENADPKRASLNRFLGISEPECYIVGGRKRVAALETVVSASPEWFQHIDSAVWKEYIGDAARFLENQFGGPPMFVAEHHDEHAPHVHFFHCPHSIGTSAKMMVGGPKHKLSTLQSLFEREVALRYGLARIKRSLGSHTRVQEFYAQVDQRFDGEAWRVLPKFFIDRLQREAELGRLRTRDIVDRYRAGDETVLRVFRGGQIEEENDETDLSDTPR